MSGDGNKTRAFGDSWMDSDEEPIPFGPPSLPKELDVGSRSSGPGPLVHPKSVYQQVTEEGHSKDLQQCASFDVNSPSTWFEAVDSGDSLAMALLGDALCWGGYFPQGVARDVTSGYDLLVKSADLRNPLGTYLLSRAQRLIGKCRELPDVADATEFQSKLLGFPQACSAAGPVGLVAAACAYRDGRIVDVDLNRQFRLVESCIESDYTDAWTVYAFCLLGGEGVDRDLHEGIRWLTRAAESMNGTAMKNLGDCYRNGIGVSKDSKRAVEWYRKAAANGQDDAMNSLGYCLRKGIGCKRNDKEATGYYRAAAEKQNASGCYNLGFSYENGFGVRKDRKEALQWYLKGATLGSAKATDSLRRLGGVS